MSQLGSQHGIVSLKISVALHIPTKILKISKNAKTSTRNTLPHGNDSNVNPLATAISDETTTSNEAFIAILQSRLVRCSSD